MHTPEGLMYLPDSKTNFISIPGYRAKLLGQLWDACIFMVEMDELMWSELFDDDDVAASIICLQNEVTDEIHAILVELGEERLPS